MATSSNNYEDQGHPSAFAKALGRTIKVLRTDLGLRRRELAERAGISYSYITEIENGNKPPSASVLNPIATALGVRMSELMHMAEGRMDAQSSERDLPSAREEPDDVLRAALPAPHMLGAYSMQPSLRGPNRDLRAAVIELERLLRYMAPDDIERLLDYARRLAR
jgi:transcriptional regulator with XRE-family HTH domain